MENKTSNAKQNPENLWVSLFCNILLPALILAKGGMLFSPKWTLVIALIFPLGYGIYDFIRVKKVNPISVIGFVSFLLTGAIGLMQLSPMWIAVKDAAVPAVIANAIWVSLYTRTPLVKTFLYSDKLFDTERIENCLTERGNVSRFDRLMKRVSLLLVGSFMLSAVLNFILARMIITSPSGTELFNQQLSRMTVLKYPVIVLPSMVMMFFALWALLRGLRDLTGLKDDELYAASLREKA